MTEVTATGPLATAAPTGQSRAWSDRNFRRLWLGSAVSTFGSEVAELGLPLLALITLSASAAEVGLLRVAQFLPFLLATLPLGILVDRYHRRSLRQMAVPERLRGRVNAAYRLISWGAVPVGAAIGGVIATQAGTWAAMVAGAVGISTATLWVAFSAVPRLLKITDARTVRPATGT